MSIDAHLTLLKQHFKAGLRHIKRGTPIYLVLGAKGAGKTALLANSGLALTSPHPLDAGIHTTTHHCQWWYHTHAAFLDTEAYPSSELWQAWLTWLIKHQRKYLIKGILLTLPIDAWYEERIFDATQQTLEHLLEGLHLYPDIPIHLVLTRSDRLAGFSEFFEKIDSKEAEQMFGLMRRSWSIRQKIQRIRLLGGLL